MNQIITDNQVAVSELYIFDFDNVAYRHRPQCYPRIETVAGGVVHAYTGIDHKQGGKTAMNSFRKTGDGFAVFRERYGDTIYHAMHRHFNMVVRFDVTGEKSPELPQKILELSQHAKVCFVSHCTQRSLKMAMTRLGYSPVLINGHAYGMEDIGGWKHDPSSGVFKRICERYEVLPLQAHLIEDSQRNIDAALECGIGGATLIHDNQTTIDFVRGELDRLQESPKQHNPISVPA